jgi:hypothetical protein
MSVILANQLYSEDGLFGCCSDHSAFRQREGSILCGVVARLNLYGYLVCLRHQTLELVLRGTAARDEVAVLRLHSATSYSKRVAAPPASEAAPARKDRALFPANCGSELVNSNRIRCLIRSRSKRIAFVRAAKAPSTPRRAEVMLSILARLSLRWHLFSRYAICDNILYWICAMGMSPDLISQSIR